MKKTSLLVAIITILLISQPLLSVAAPGNSEIAKAYEAADYTSVAQLLEQQIAGLQEKAASDNRTDTHELYRLYLFLAHTHAWKLNQFDAALSEYQKAIDLRLAREQAAMQERAKQQMNIPTFEFLFIGGMYEQKKDYRKALEYYQKTVQQVQAVTDNATDGDMAMIGQDFIGLAQYLIDGIQLKLMPAKDFKPQLKTINLLYSASPQFFSLMMSQLLPDLEYAGTLAERTGLQTYIKANPATIHSMLLEYIILSNVSAGSMSPDVQQALAAFLSKYPDSYFSLLFRHLMARYYKENGENDKAKRYMSELQAIARSRHMELITEPEKKFATPEATWEFYRKALCAGDINGALSCHIPGDTEYRKAFTQLGPETVKKIGNDMGPIEKIISDTSTAKYRIKRLQEGKEITFHIYFVNINGEWKIQQY